MPNITGDMTFFEMISGVPSSGAFLTSNQWTPNTYRDSGGGYTSTVNLDASRSNPIYGASNTVQPASIKLIPILKY